MRQDKVIRGHRDVWARAPIEILALPPKTTSPRGLEGAPNGAVEVVEQAEGCCRRRCNEWSAPAG
jgi:hypothetical protein